MKNKKYESVQDAKEILTEAESILWGRFADEDGNCGEVIEYVRTGIMDVHEYLDNLIDKKTILEAHWGKYCDDYTTSNETLRVMGFSQVEIDSFRDKKKHAEESLEDDCADNN